MPDQLLVTLTEELSAASLNRFASRHGLGVIERLVGLSPIYLFQILDGVDAADKLPDVALDSRVLKASLNWLTPLT